MKRFVLTSYLQSGIFTLLLLCTFATHAQSLNGNWKKDLTVSLEEFLKCEGSSECAGFTGKALNTLYKINDFYLQKEGRYMTVNEISAFLRDNSKWTNLGKPYDQKILETAQDLANAKKAVVAVYQNAQGIGHVALIAPGALQPSGSWGLSVPGAVSFLTTDPQKSFVDKSLSFAFSKGMMKDVTIYGRNY